MQQESIKKLGFTAKQTMILAQQLYEGIAISGENIGLITYMRTDSVNISADFINIKDAIYHASVDTLLDLLVTQENEGTILMVGHNPSMHYLTELLTGTLIDKFPTCALAEIELTTSWVDIRNASHTLVNFYTPKDYARS